MSTGARRMSEERARLINSADGAAEGGRAWETMAQPYAVVNAIIGAVFNLGINVGFAYWLVHGDVGLFKPPPHRPNGHRYKQPAYVDLVITAVLISFLSTLISTVFINADVKKGKVSRADTRIGPKDAWPWHYYRLYPRFKGVFARSVAFAIVASVTLYGAWIGVWAAICKAGDRDCLLERHTFVWVKGFFAGVFYIIFYPAILLTALDSTLHEGQG